MPWDFALRSPIRIASFPILPFIWPTVSMVKYLFPLFSVKELSGSNLLVQLRHDAQFFKSTKIQEVLKETSKENFWGGVPISASI
ncbi:unnamed protein product [Blepharisma stoltei]|uniref:Uncharacterized protein n=1 Tax=Blepharisma stoltei TaxID=1481888 RepID=A0AAU9J1E8_9CILI|nr:unnamed protein product [Blepharisma stoltei]